MRIHITVNVPSAEQTRATKPKPKPCLKDKVEYAIDQIIARTSSKQRAIEFLREAFHHLDGLPQPDEESQALKETVKIALRDYGMYHKGSSQKERSE